MRGVEADLAEADQAAKHAEASMSLDQVEPCLWRLTQLASDHDRRDFPGTGPHLAVARPVLVKSPARVGRNGLDSTPEVGEAGKPEKLGRW